MLLLMFDHHAFSSRDMHSELFLSTSDALHVKFYHVKTSLNHPMKLIAKKKEKKKNTLDFDMFVRKLEFSVGHIR